jgi:hypothetical protein
MKGMKTVKDMKRGSWYRRGTLASVAMAAKPPRGLRPRWLEMATGRMSGR